MVEDGMGMVMVGKRAFSVRQMVENALFMIVYENICHGKTDIMHMWTCGKKIILCKLYNLVFVGEPNAFP